MEQVSLVPRRGSRGGWMCLGYTNEIPWGSANGDAQRMARCAWQELRGKVWEGCGLGIISTKTAGVGWMKLLAEWADWYNQRPNSEARVKKQSVGVGPAKEAKDPSTKKCSNKDKYLFTLLNKGEVRNRRKRLAMDAKERVPFKGRASSYFSADGQEKDWIPGLNPVQEINQFPSMCASQNDIIWK